MEEVRKRRRYARPDAERSREMLMLKIKEVHSGLRDQFAGLDFLGELKGLEVGAA